LDLCFELTNDKIRDIRLCHQFEAAEPEEREYKSVYFYFYKDDAIDFSPDQSFIKLKSQVEKAFRDYKALEEADELNINTLKDWRDKHQQVYVEFINAMPFIHNLFRAFDEFDRVVWKVDSILKGK
jgi:hypothetical protein